MKRFLTCAAMVLAAASAHAQGVGINATGAAADTSAILDLSSTTKGLLVPRLTAAQRAAIVLPATGLVVYQTDGTAGLYWNAGTPAAPSWKQVGEAGAGGGGQWTTSGSNIYYSAGKVAVGTTPTQFRFAVQDTGSVFRVQSNNPTGLMASLGGFGQVQVDAPGVVGGRLALLGNGNLGLGVANPTNKLSFAPVLGKKISLYPGATGDVGFGVAANRLQIYADNPNADVAIGYDAAGTFNERFAVKPNGALAVGGNTGTAGQVLQSGGGGAAATWVSPGAANYADVYQITSNARTTIAAGNPTHTAIPGLSQTITVGGNAKAIINYSLLLTAGGAANVEAGISFGPGLVHVDEWLIAANETKTESATFSVSMGPGTHTISIQVSAWGNSVTVGDYQAVYGNTMTIQVIRQ